MSTLNNLREIIISFGISIVIKVEVNVSFSLKFTHYGTVADVHVHIVFTISQKYTWFLRIFIIIFTCCSETLRFLASIKLFALGSLLTIKPINLRLRCSFRFLFRMFRFTAKEKKIKKTNGKMKTNKERNWGKCFLARNLATTRNLTDKFS